MDSKKIAIIGAGVVGLGMANFFKSHGWSVSVYEREADPGGTWCKKFLYADLTLHSKTGTYLFPEFPFHDHQHNIKKESASGEQINAYINAYIEHYDLNGLIHYHCPVEKLIYERLNNKVTVVTSNISVADQEFDFAIVTGHTTSLKIPAFANQDKFKGQILHSSQARKAVLDKAIADNKKVVVLGGNKSATDMAYYFGKRSYSKLLWLHRRTHWFLKQEKMKPSVDMFYFLGIMFWLFHRAGKVSRKTAEKLVRFMAKREIIINPKESNYGEFLDVWHAGIMHQKLYDVLQTITDKKDEISAFGEHSLHLKSGEEIECDLLICATGYDSRLGFPIIEEINEQGEQINSDIFDADMLYRGHIHPHFPRIGFAHKRTIFFGATSLGNVMGYWFYKFFKRVDNQSSEELLASLKTALIEEEKLYHKHDLVLGKPFAGSYVHENLFFWFLLTQRYYKQDLQLKPGYFMSFFWKFARRKTHTHKLLNDLD